ncbi:hypothetical protein [Streptomyces sp. NPDC090025]|uniref:hypothetical protein n=1 Tax=Streptomyces sp. NPDC090025 TaxID=3365922 RepID=UPI003832960F
MISEPELVGGAEFSAPGTALHEPPPPPPAEPPGPGSRARRPWLWAVGGAVAASVVWAGGLYAYDRQNETTGPDLRGYRAVEPCQVGAFHGLAAALGPRGEATNPMVLDESALYSTNCLVQLEAKPVPYELEVTYRLHRVIDPRPEFEALMRDPMIGGGDRIDGIGDTAFVNDDDTAMTLDVVDGQAELRLRVSPSLTWDGKGEPPAPPKLDPAALRTYLVEDARELMKELKKQR